VGQIAYLGPEGTFTEQALRSLPEADEVELLPAASVRAALDAVRKGQAEAACVPVENSVEGTVAATMDALAEGEPLVAVRETVLPVRFAILVRPGTAVDEIRTVSTHPHAAAQVQLWLAANLPDAAVLPAYSTAAAALAVSKGEADAAVSAPVALRHYSLQALATDVADVPDAVTRFLLVRPPGKLLAPTGKDRTSLMAVTEDRVGALLQVLTEFAVRGINLSRIESRPTKGRLGEYRFFLDCDGHIEDARIGEALAAVHRRCVGMRFLGSYPRVSGGLAMVAPGAADSDFEMAQAWLADVRSGRGA
jgi:prephenate dehydratase